MKVLNAPPSDEFRRHRSIYGVAPRRATTVHELLAVRIRRFATIFGLVQRVSPMMRNVQQGMHAR